MLKRIVGLPLLLAVLAGCSANAVDAPTRGLITFNKGPITTGTGDVKHAKHGEAKCYYFMIPFINLSFAWGDGSLEEAQKNGSISQLTTADSENLLILIFGIRKTHAYGN